MRDAAVMLVIKDGLILAVSRRQDKTKFGLPGGKREPHELLYQAAIRECYEETSIQVSKDCQLIFYREEPKDTPAGEDFRCYCYYATSWDGEPKSSEEGIVRWLTASELTGSCGAFADYNSLTLQEFKKHHPNVELK